MQNFLNELCYHPLSKYSEMAGSTVDLILIVWRHRTLLVHEILNEAFWGRGDGSVISSKQEDLSSTPPAPYKS